MYFKDIPGKKDEKQQLIQQVKLGKIPHAQLFLGKEGYGELALALAFSRFIMCHSPEKDEDVYKRQQLHCQNFNH